MPSRDGLVTDFCGKHLRARQTCLLAAFKDWGMLGRRWGSESPEPICHYGEDFLPIFCRKLEHRIKLLPRPPLMKSSIPCENYANHEWRKPDVGHQHGISTPIRISADAFGAVRIPPRRVLSYAHQVCWSANRRSARDSDGSAKLQTNGMRRYIPLNTARNPKRGGQEPNSQRADRQNATRCPTDRQFRDGRAG